MANSDSDKLGLHYPLLDKFDLDSCKRSGSTVKDPAFPSASTSNKLLPVDIVKQLRCPRVAGIGLAEKDSAEKDSAERTRMMLLSRGSQEQG